MKKGIQSEDETDRLAAITQLNILSGDSEERFDRIIRIAQRMFAVPMADFSVIDADSQHLKSAYGYSLSRIDRIDSLANHAMMRNGVFVVNDAQEDDRFSGNPLIISQPKIRFFASYPIRTRSGQRVGALSIADRVPRSLSAHDQSVFRDLAEMIENELTFMQVAQFDRATQMSINDGFYSQAEQGLRVCERQKKSAVAVVFDVRRLTPATDTERDIEHDRHIRVFANQLRHFFRKSDVIGRIGRQEFAVMLLDAQGEDVATIVKKLKASIDIHNADSEYRHRLSFLHAFSEFDPAHAVTSSTLVEMAKRLLVELDEVG
ncbi:diguanylate cyclase [Reinekea blandensis]|uniref:diguanylate cyclase n=1 Tax=Reinekea blandensis TaxID=374838 RepID=UPI000300CD4B|nr:diguanylate cyclase [Reinekea blandensis]